jgi:hypothetical protein
VATKRFDRARVKGFLELACERLEGDWLLIGGGAAAAWFAPGRTTEDLDIVGLGGSQQERFALMELAASAGLPIEAVNSAADFFVRRVTGWRDHLVELHRGTTATVYRPDATLFLLLKIQRLSEVDLDDCLALLDHCVRENESIALADVTRAVDQLPATEDAHLQARRVTLSARLRSAVAR